MCGEHRDRKYSDSGLWGVLVWAVLGVEKNINCQSIALFPDANTDSPMFGICLVKTTLLLILDTLRRTKIEFT